jgi:hypothetical protein
LRSFLVVRSPLRLAAQNPAAPAKTQEGPLLRSTVQEVWLDLVVRHQRQRMSRGLQPSDVEVFEDGLRQKGPGSWEPERQAVPERERRRNRQTSFRMIPCDC